MNRRDYVIFAEIQHSLHIAPSAGVRRQSWETHLQFLGGRRLSEATKRKLRDLLSILASPVVDWMPCWMRLSSSVHQGTSFKSVRHSLCPLSLFFFPKPCCSSSFSSRPSSCPVRDSQSNSGELATSNTKQNCTLHCPFWNLRMQTLFFSCTLPTFIDHFNCFVKSWIREPPEPFF